MANFMKNKSIVYRYAVSLLIIAVLVYNMYPAGVHLADAAAKPKLAKSKLNLYVGKSYKFNVKGCTWKSSKNKVASVSSKGKVKAKKAGTAKITATLKKNKKKAVCIVKVGNYAKSLTVTSALTVVLMPGQKSQMRVSIAPSGVLYKDITYTSSDSSIATVANDGMIRPMANGTATITATTKAITSSGKKIKKTITVVVIGYADNTNTPEPAGVETDIPNLKDYDVIVVPPSEKPTQTPMLTEGPQTTNTPQATDTPEATSTPAVTDNPTVTAAPTATPTASPSPEPTKRPMTIKDYIDSFVVDANSPLVGSLVISDANGDMKTLYFLNKEYSGIARISIDGYSYSNSGDVVSFLDALVKERGGVTNSSQTVKVYRRKVTEKWQISLLQTNPIAVYYLEALKDDTLYGSPYGLIIADGNTLEHITVTN